jgi:trans-2,3-dihydro-3-hydroxyanthranilate isomerase
VLHSELSAAAAEETWELELSSGIVSVLTRGRDGWVEASMDQLPARFGVNVTGELTDRYRRALGLPLAAVYADLPMQVVSTGLPYLIVPVHAQGLATAHIATPDFEAILAASGAKFVYVLDPAIPEGRTWDNTGRIEDVATGSAAGPAAAYLIEHRVHPAGVCRCVSPKAASRVGPARSRSGVNPATGTTGSAVRWPRWPAVAFTHGWRTDA